MDALITGCNLPKIKQKALCVVNIMSAHRAFAIWLND